MGKNDKMKNELSKLLKELRIRHGFGVHVIAMALGISEEQYMMFEQGMSTPEDDYFILMGLSCLYGTDLKGALKTSRVSKFVSDVFGDFKDFSPKLREAFLSAAAKVKEEDRAEYSAPEALCTVVKFPYTDEEGRAYSALLCGCDDECGYYFVDVDGEVTIAELKNLGGEKCFEYGNKVYPLKFGEVKMFARICGKIYTGDEKK